MNTGLARKAIAEFGGTAVLLGAAIGGGKAAAANGAPAYATLLIGTLAAAAALFTVLHAIGPLSGGHINPAVTISMVTTGHIGYADAVVYIVAQTLGGIVGAAAANGLWEQALVAGAGSGTLTVPMYAAEVIATCGLVGAIHAAILGGNDSRIPTIVPAAVLAGSFAAPFGLANPAVVVGAGLVGGGLDLEAIGSLVVVEMLFASTVGVGVAMLYGRLGSIEVTGRRQAYDLSLGDIPAEHHGVVTDAIKASIRDEDCLIATAEDGWRVVFASAEPDVVESAGHRIEAMVQLALVGVAPGVDQLQVDLAPVGTR